MDLCQYDPQPFDFCLSAYVQIPLGYVVDDPGKNWSAYNYNVKEKQKQMIATKV